MPQLGLVPKSECSLLNILPEQPTIITRVHGRIHSLKVVLPIFLMLAAQMAAVHVASMRFARAAP
jgi:hypothetical protein